MADKKQDRPQRIYNSLRAVLPTLLLLWGIVFINLNARTVFGVISNALSSSFGIPGYMIVELGSYVSAGILVSLLLSSHVSYYLMHTPTLQLSLLLLIAGLLMAGVSSGIGMLRIAFVIIGLGCGLYPGSGITIANTISSEHIRGSVMAIHESGPVGAFVFVPLFTSLVLVSTNWRVIFFVYALLCLVLLLMVQFWCKDGYFRGRKLNLANIKVLFSNVSFWTLAIGFSFFGTSNILIYTSLTSYLTIERDFSEQIVSLVLSLSRGGGLLMIFLSSIAMSRLNPENVLIYTGTITGIFTVLLGLLNGTSLLIMVFLQTFAISGYFPALFVSLGKFFPGRFQNLAVATTSIFAQGLGIIMPLLGTLFSRREQSDLFFTLLGIGMLVLVLFSLFLLFARPLAEEEEGAHT